VLLKSYEHEDCLLFVLLSFVKFFVKVRIGERGWMTDDG
jgi:hypothetical protein